MTQTLYAFDSANYALAVQHFYNVAFHQPHPPGYPLYVFFARAIDLVVHDANRVAGRSKASSGARWPSACTIALGRAHVRAGRRPAGRAAAGDHRRLLGLRRGGLPVRRAGGRDGHAGPARARGPGRPRPVDRAARAGLGDLGRRALGRRRLLRAAVAVGAVVRRLAAAVGLGRPGGGGRRGLGGPDGRSSAAAGTCTARRWPTT